MKKSVFVSRYPFWMDLFPELWNAEHHRLGNPSSFLPDISDPHWQCTYTLRFWTDATLT